MPPPQPPAPPVETRAVRIVLATTKPLVIGRTGSITVRVTNAGGAALNGLVVRLSPAADLRLLSGEASLGPAGLLGPAAQPPCAVAGGDLECAWASLDPAATVEAVIPVRVLAGSGTPAPGVELTFTVAATDAAGEVTLHPDTRTTLQLSASPVALRQVFTGALATVAVATTVACPPGGNCAAGAGPWGPQDRDENPATTNATSAPLSLPATGTAIRWAGLYWGGARCEQPCGSPLVRVGEGDYLAVGWGETSWAGDRVQGFVDVTDLFVVDVGPADRSTFWVADLPVAADRPAGWVLVVVSDAADPASTVSVIDGLSALPVHIALALDGSGPVEVAVLTSDPDDASPVEVTVGSTTTRLESASGEPDGVPKSTGWDLGTAVIEPAGTELVVVSGRGGWFGLAVISSG